MINDELALPDGCVIDQVHMVSSSNASQGADSCVEEPAGGCLMTKSSCHISGLECYDADFDSLPVMQSDIPRPTQDNVSELLKRPISVL